MIGQIRKSKQNGHCVTEIIDTKCGKAVLETWRKNGKIHRSDGPAFYRPDGNGKKEWYWCGERLNFDEWCKRAGKNDVEMRIKWFGQIA